MKTVAPVALLLLLLLCFTATAAVSGDASTETPLTAAPGDIVLLPCPSAAGNVTPATPAVPVWTKDGQEVIKVGVSTPGDHRRLTVLHNGSLNIDGVTPADEGTYLCAYNNTFRARVQLLVASGPENVSALIGLATVLDNGSLIVFRGDTVQFNCSASSYPTQELSWAFTGASSSNQSLASTSGSWLDFRIEDIQPSAQGLYSCLANNTVSHQTANESKELLVYYAPDRHPECSWSLGPDPSDITFLCTWLGAYPAPTLLWGEDRGAQGAQWMGHVYVSGNADSLSLALNRSSLSAGQTIRCMAQHLAITVGKQKNCSFSLKPPFPEGEPLVSALEETDVTLICSEEVSTPPANTTWRRGLEQEEIVPGSKYVLTEEGTVFKLTILNVTKDDQGVYFCRSENPLAVRELEVYLTVRTSSAYTGAIIGIFIAVLIVGLAVVIARTVYSSRHKICLGNGFGPVDDDRGDVLSLVESDDEQIFQDAVPRLPPLTNGHQTTLVQIHRIPSSDHEDGESADTSSQQLDDTEQREEPEDLVTF